MPSKQSLFDLKKKTETEKIPKALWLCLNYTENHKEDIIQIGVAWVDKDKFIVNTNIFAAFINRKVHTINRNLREHSFTTTKLSQNERNHFFSILNILPFSNDLWCLRSHPSFTRDSDEKIIDQLPYKSIPKKSMRNKMTGISQNSQSSNNSNILSSTNNADNPSCLLFFDIHSKTFKDFDLDEYDYSDYFFQSNSDFDPYSI